MALRTDEQLKQLFDKIKLSQQRKKEREKQHYKKASQKVKKELDRKHIKEQKQSQPEPLKQVKMAFSLSIYNSSLIERESAEEDLYQTREELMNDTTGKINWDVWDRLVKRLRNTL